MKSMFESWNFATEQNFVRSEAAAALHGRRSCSCPSVATELVLLVWKVFTSAGRYDEADFLTQVNAGCFRPIAVAMLGRPLSPLASSTTSMSRSTSRPSLSRKRAAASNLPAIEVSRFWIRNSFDPLWVLWYSSTILCKIFHVSGTGNVFWC